MRGVFEGKGGGVGMGGALPTSLSACIMRMVVAASHAGVSYIHVCSLEATCVQATCCWLEFVYALSKADLDLCSGGRSRILRA